MLLRQCEKNRKNEKGFSKDCTAKQSFSKTKTKKEKEKGKENKFPCICFMIVFNIIGSNQDI
jgi:hypothetical protein